MIDGRVVRVPAAVEAELAAGGLEPTRADILASVGMARRRFDPARHRFGRERGLDYTAARLYANRRRWNPVLEALVVGKLIDFGYDPAAADEDHWYRVAAHFGVTLLAEDYDDSRPPWSPVEDLVDGAGLRMAD